MGAGIQRWWRERPSFDVPDLRGPHGHPIHTRPNPWDPNQVISYYVCDCPCPMQSTPSITVRIVPNRYGI